MGAGAAPFGSRALRAALLENDCAGTYSLGVFESFVSGVVEADRADFSRHAVVRRTYGRAFGGGRLMNIYTVILAKPIRFDDGRRENVDFYTSIVEAETCELARYEGARLPIAGRWKVRAEVGDTRHKHSGCQDLFFEPRQVDIEQIPILPPSYRGGTP
jgi:hypothetical protein